VSIFDGFEGYRDPTEEEALTLLRRAPVILDANVLLDLYTFDEPSRTVALNYLEAIKSRLFIPHQVMREFWRNRHSVIAEVEDPKRPLESVRQDLLTILNGLRPDRERPEELVAMRAEIEGQLDALSARIDKARGAPFDKARALQDTSLDPVVVALEATLDGRVGQPFDEETEALLIEEGLKRFERKVPPGFADADDKREQLPERGTGDFLLWEQSLRHVQSQQGVNGFVLVTNDKKEDWRVVLTKPKKQALGVRPELVAESRDRAGAPVVLLSQTDFYRLLAKLEPDTAGDAASLIDAAARAATNVTNAVDQSNEWSFDAYVSLVGDLEAAGYGRQADVIVIAAESGGFVARAEIYAAAGYSDERSLKRFSYPAQRFALGLVERDLLSEDAPPPLLAMYDGPGKSVGYRVPDEFVRHEARRSATRSATWLEAAAEAARTSPDKVWTVDALLEKIREMGLKDLSRAKTPEATLRRDLSVRDERFFVPVDGGYKLRDAQSNMED
jgi:hypothetical protein